MHGSMRGKNNMKTIKPKDNDFKFLMEIQKSSIEYDDDGQRKMVIRGIASGTRKDRQGDTFSKSGLLSIKKAIEEGFIDEEGDWQQIPLLSDHKSTWDNQLGWVVKADIDETDHLWIEAELDPNSSKAKELYSRLTTVGRKGRPAKFGFSVKGQVDEYHFVYDQEVQKAQPIFDRMKLKEISVTQAPVYPTPYPIVIAKSLQADEEYQQGMEEIMETVEVNGVEVSVQEDPQITNNSIAQPASDVQMEQEAPEEESTAPADDQVEAPVSGAPVETEVTDDKEVPAGYAVHPQNTESDVAAAETNDEEPVEFPTTTENSEEEDEVGQIKSTLQTVVDAVESLRQAVEKLNEEKVTPEVQETVEKSMPENTDDDLDSRISVAVAKALSDLNFVKDIEAMKSMIEDISHDPADNSISISKSKDESKALSPEEFYSQLVNEGVDPISAGVRAKYGYK